MNQIQNTENIREYAAFLTEVKERIQTAQVRANLAVNRELVVLYWQIGQMISERQGREGWGARVIDRLAQDLKNDLPAIKGFSARNLRRMKQFFNEYPFLSEFVENAQLPVITEKQIGPQAAAKLMQPIQGILEKRPQAAAELASLCMDLPWMHNTLLMEKVKNLDDRLWYMRKTIEQGWSRNVLGLQIKSRAHEREGQAITNFEESTKRSASPNTNSPVLYRSPLKARFQISRSWKLSLLLARATRNPILRQPVTAPPPHGALMGNR